MDAFSFRRAIPGDAAEIARVHVTSWRAAYPGIVPQAYLDSLDEVQFAERWRHGLANADAMSIFVAETGDHLCGFASGGPIRKSLSAYDAELYCIYLLPTVHRQGIGRELFLQVAGALARQGMHSLLVWVLRQNPATEFYKRLGGELIAEDVIEIGGATLPEVAYGWTNLPTAIA